MASTMMACEPAAMKTDAALAELLAAPVKVELAPGAEPALRLITPANATLSFKGQMTPEARYGAPTRVFLEVAAQTVACKNPLSGATTCIQVRERRFDEQGLMVGTPGSWQPFYDPIEGYTHQPGGAQCAAAETLRSRHLGRRTIFRLRPRLGGRVGDGGRARKNRTWSPAR